MKKRPTRQNNSFKNFLKLITASKFLTLAVVFVLAAIPLLALAQYGLEYGTLTGLGSEDLRVTIMKIVRIILGLVGIIAIIIIIYAGYVWMTSAGNEEKIDYAKRTLRNAVIGLIIIFLAFAIVSFIINALIGATGAGRQAGGPPTGCTNCSNLGRGIIQSVYPAPFARDVARNTLIMVSFKVPMDPSSIIDGVDVPDDPDSCGGDSNPCTGKLKDDSVKIFLQGQDEKTTKLAGSQVDVSSSDGKTFVFNPVAYLGDGINNVWYETKLTNEILRNNGEKAFPGVNGFFSWQFEIGTYLDLDPVEMQTVFPRPDNQADDYDLSDPVQATGSVRFLSQPSPAVAASVGLVTPETTEPAIPVMTVAGSYNCQTDSTITVTRGSDSLTIASDPAVTGLLPSVVWIDPNVEHNIGCGLRLKFASATFGGNQWHFNVVAAKAPDTLRIDTKTYIFVASNPTGDQIKVDSATVDNIVNKINSGNLRITAIAATNRVNLAAALAGSAGNNLSIQATGDWAELCNGSSPVVCNEDANPLMQLSAGVDAGLSATPRDAKDVPRNVIINFDFNEAINVAQLPTETVTPKPSGCAAIPSDPPATLEERAKQYCITHTTDSDCCVVDSRIKIEYNSAGTWIPVAGALIHSNQYKTAEFIPDSECLDASGNLIINSCGDKIYCLPVNRGYCLLAISTACDTDSDCAASDTCQYTSTNYRISLKAGLLETCDPAANPSNCVDSNFNACAATPGGDEVCQSSTGVNYPVAQISPQGIVDAANNSFNGNSNTQSVTATVLGRADGPQSQSGAEPYSLNPPLNSNLGDDLVWSFYVNKDLDLTPPNLSDIGPNLGARGVSLILPVASTFSEVMMSSTLKAGTNYKDGLCGCDPRKTSATTGKNSDCQETEICDEILANWGKCKSETGSQLYCEKDNECKNKTCINKKYVSLLDNSTAPVGYWITKNELDTLPPLDGWSDQTQAVINHSRFLEVTNYGAEIGSGVKDAYQNCYKPSAGPTGATNECFIAKTACVKDSECPTGDRCVSVCLAADSASCCEPPDNDKTKVYCCEGAPKTQAEWEDSACFSGY